MCRALTVDELFEEVENYIRDAMEILDKEEYLKLEGLDQKVAAICNEVMSLPQEATREYLGRMDTMVTQLDLLKKVMEEHKAKIADQLNSVDANRRAHQAYAKSDVMTPRIVEDEESQN